MSLIVKLNFSYPYLDLYVCKSNIVLSVRNIHFLVFDEVFALEGKSIRVL